MTYDIPPYVDGDEYLVRVDSECYYCYDRKQVMFLSNNAVGILICFVIKGPQAMETNRETVQQKNTPNWIVHNDQPLPDVAGGYIHFLLPKADHPLISISKQEFDVFQMTSAICITDTNQLRHVSDNARLAIVRARINHASIAVTVDDKLCFTNLTAIEVMKIIESLYYTETWVVFYRPLESKHDDQPTQQVESDPNPAAGMLTAAQAGLDLSDPITIVCDEDLWKGLYNPAHYDYECKKYVLNEFYFKSVTLKLTKKETNVVTVLLDGQPFTGDLDFEKFDVYMIGYKEKVNGRAYAFNI